VTTHGGELELIDNPFYRRLVNYLQERRRTAHVIAASGRLDTSCKFEISFYEVLTLDYCIQNLEAQQGIPAPASQTDEEYRESLVMDVQRMIMGAVDTSSRPDLLFFLDKSSRPVAWLFRELWPLFAPPDAHMPEIKFISIDANRLFGRVGDDRPTEDEIYSWEPDPRQIEQLQGVYLRGRRKVPRHPDIFAAAWVIDEVSVSGGTVLMAGRLIKAAFPALEVSPKVWMASGRIVSGSRGAEAFMPANLAPWYSKHFPYGRGVGERGPSQFLSARGPRDPLSEARRTDVELLARDIARGRQSVRPLVGCFEIDPRTGREDLARPRYKVARFVKGRREVILPPKGGSPDRP